MNFEVFTKKYLEPFRGLKHIFDERGYLVWRFGTGENLEILHLRAFEKRKGNATKLISEMVEWCETTRKPYYSVFGFMLSDNTAVISLYRNLGFSTHTIPAVYKAGNTTIVSIPYEDLKTKLKEMGLR